MSVEVRVPQLGESVTEAVITRWMKVDGETVSADEPLCELESDKATLELPSPAAGTLRITKQAGETVKVDEVIAAIEAGAAKPAAPAKAAPAPTPPTAAKPATPPPAPPQKAPEPRPATVTPLSPAARRIAEEQGVDTAAIAGTGRGGRITKPDVVAAAAAKPAQAVPTTAPAVAVRTLSADDEERVPMTPLRKTIARRLVEAQHTAAILTTFNEVDMSAVMALRARYKDQFAEKHGVSLGFMSFFSRACVLALQNYPVFCASLDPAAGELVLKKYMHIGFAADTPHGLVVPVVRDADRKDVFELARDLATLSEKARAGKLTAAEMQGGCFTISSLGGIGGTAFTPIINPPEVAILGVSKAAQKPVYEHGGFVPRLMLPLSLSYDHRVIDGASAVRFTSFLGQALADVPGLLRAIP